MSSCGIDAYLLDRLAASARRLTFTDLVRSARHHLGVDRQAVTAAVRRLLADGSLAYVQQLGRTFLEISYHHGRKVSARICLVPETVPPLHENGDAGIRLRLSAGAAFGAGDHPTTRLALQAIDGAFGAGWMDPGARVLDVGTGSGILAIAAVLLGAGCALGVDIDPNALWEARRNARINGIADRVAVEETPVALLEGPFDLILANLRLPTLVVLGPEFARLLEPEGKLVVSGFRPAEWETLRRAYQGEGLRPLFENSAQDWQASVFSRPGKAAEMADRPL